MSKEPKHTPPPWEAGVGRIVGIPEDMFGVFARGRNGNPLIVAVTGRVSDAEYRDESIADALFIATAPRLYETLLIVYDTLREGAGQFSVDTLCDMIDAELKKARGEVSR